ncbi:MULTISPECIES: chorismate mutase [Actinomadura]|uniref:chorismate mutase n=1 Tax=Actinomadura TaxID=1988 RepID=UPI0003F8A807|nr:MULTISPECIES: chorismate mutase [Actinomadura]RSN46749.1 chorismate mutase [Actinomadura sp. WAC 06369]
MDAPRSLADVRNRIDGIDAELVRLLAERQALVRAAAAFKTDERSVRAPDRVEQVVALARSRAADAGLSPDVAEPVWRAMIGAFIELELGEVDSRDA